MEHVAPEDVRDAELTRTVIDEMHGSKGRAIENDTDSTQYAVGHAMCVCRIAEGRAFQVLPRVARGLGFVSCHSR